MDGNTAGRDGGGIWPAGATTLVRSTVSGNTAGRDGGGIAAGTANLTGVTVSGNTAGDLLTGTGRGGGVFATRGAFLNATIVENRAFEDVSGGGGFFSLASAEPIRVRNTIIADNFVRFEQNDVSGTFFSEGTT